MASTSRGAPWPSIAKPCASPPPCRGGERNRWRRGSAPAFERIRFGGQSPILAALHSLFDSNWPLIYGPPALQTLPIGRARRMYRSVATGGPHGQSWAGVGQRSLQGISAAQSKGTRQTPRERRILMRYPWGISDMSDAETPWRRLGAGCRQRESLR